MKLVADIGGTHFNVGLLLENDHKPAIAHVRKLLVSDFQSPAHATQSYLKQLSRDSAIEVDALTDAAFAVATPVRGDQVAFTNSPWSFSVRQVQHELQLERLCVVNDFEALALSLPSLRPEQYRAHGLKPRTEGMLSVVGPGTGLGVAATQKTASGWVALPSEGGHATLAAQEPLEFEVLRVLYRSYQHVSAERVISGLGLPLLYSALGQVQAVSGNHEFTAKEIIEQGLQDTQSLSSETLDLFCALLGSFCGSVALTLGSRSGLFVGGGIVPRLGQRFFDSNFRARFESKGRFQAYLADIPTALIIDPYAALSGAASLIADSVPSSQLAFSK